MRREPRTWQIQRFSTTPTGHRICYIASGNATFSVRTTNEPKK